MDMTATRRQKGRPARDAREPVPGSEYVDASTWRAQPGHSSPVGPKRKSSRDASALQLGSNDPDFGIADQCSD